MAANKIERIKRSRVLAHPLLGRAGLSHATGHSRDCTVISDAWAVSLRPRTLYPTSPQEADWYGASDYSTFIRDKATQAIVAATGRSGQPQFEAGSMSVILSLLLFL